MTRIITLLAAAFAASALGAPVAAQAVDQDVRCWMASNVFVKSEKDAQKRQVAAISAVYYLGRIDARMSMQQLKTAVGVQSKLLKPDNLGPVMTACATRLRDKEMALRAMAGPAPAAPAKK